MRLRAHGMTVLLAVLLGLVLIPAATGQIRFRISLENTTAHVQVKAVQRFTDELAERTRGRMSVELYPNAQLYRDRDVVAALAQGKVEMAVPGTWQLDRFAPSVGVLYLPVFYGRDRFFVYDALEGELGTTIDRRIETATGTIVLGGWIDLGNTLLFTLQEPIERHEDIEGLSIRYAGGGVNEMRLRLLGADPVLIPWPDLRQRLLQNEVDGLLTTYETVASARLWEAGVAHAFEDRESFVRYVPLVSTRFWNRLPADLRVVIREVWEKHVDEARSDAARAQVVARETLRDNGVTIVIPSAREHSRWRRVLRQSQDDMIEALGLDSEIRCLIPVGED